MPSRPGPVDHTCLTMDGKGRRPGRGQVLDGHPERARGQSGERVGVLVGGPAGQAVLVFGVVGQEQVRVLEPATARPAACSGRRPERQTVLPWGRRSCRGPAARRRPRPGWFCTCRRVLAHFPDLVLPDREASSLAAWLAKRPGIEVVCRDRAPFFAEGATVGAPQAVQVADRWHLWHNPSEAAERCVADHRGCLRVLVPDPAQPAPEPDEVPDPTGSPWPTGHRFADRTRAKHATVHELLAPGSAGGRSAGSFT
ncbi:transposase [Streptomyces sp. KS 21]|nr:transposase [Streptomyces sp. KS 21]